MISQIAKSQIHDSADIYDVVSDFVTLKRAGANYKGLCPFHGGRTPSFMVSPAKNYCKCFACGKGGNPVGFIMEYNSLSYPDALRWLAKKYGIEINESEETGELESTSQNPVEINLQEEERTHLNEQITNLTQQLNEAQALAKKWEDAYHDLRERALKAYYEKVAEIEAMKRQ